MDAGGLREQLGHGDVDKSSVSGKGLVFAAGLLLELVPCRSGMATNGLLQLHQELVH